MKNIYIVALLKHTIPSSKIEKKHDFQDPSILLIGMYIHREN